MALSSVERVRRKISDRPELRRETVDADGLAKNFKLQYQPVNASPVPEVWANDILQTEATDYTVNYDQGIVTFANAPAVNVKLVFQYYSVVWTDVELQDFLDQYSDNSNISAAHVLFAWSADVAKLAKRETLSGGGGLGAVTKDTSVAARELRNTAKALMDWEIEYGVTLGAQIPADGLTEVPWTEAALGESEFQQWVREN
jgi:hypothetical protein